MLLMCTLRTKSYSLAHQFVTLDFHAAYYIRYNITQLYLKKNPIINYVRKLDFFFKPVVG